MHKRVEFYVRNPGYEGTVDAMGVLAIDFEDEEAYKRALDVVNQKFVHSRPAHFFSLTNERGEVLGIVPEYVVSWRAFDVEDGWRAVFSLPPSGDPPPARET